MLVNRRSEQQYMHAIAVIGDRMQEKKQHARIAIHRAGDIAQHDQRRSPTPALAPGERDDRSARGRHRAQTGAQVDRRTAIGDHGAPGRDFGQRQAQSRDHRLDLGQFIDAHRFEVPALQYLARRKRQRGIEFDFLSSASFVARRSGGWRHRVGEPRRQRRFGLVARHAAVDTRQQQLQHAFEHARIAPEQLEGLIEQRLLLVALDQDRLQRRAKIFAILDADGVDRVERRDHLRRPDRQPGGAQHAREMHDVFREARAVPNSRVGASVVGLPSRCALRYSRSGPPFALMPAMPRLPASLRRPDAWRPPA